MAVREILKMGDKRLLRIAEPVTEWDSPALKKLIVDMADTMEMAGGIGLAAPQIGVNLQVIIFGLVKGEYTPEQEEVPFTVLINPVITFTSEEKESQWEGCLSIPGLRGLVPRSLAIRYDAWSVDGEMFSRAVSGLPARIVQHEYDHLIGRLYPTRIEDLTQFGFKDTLFTEQENA